MQEAFYIYQELADKYNETPLLLNGMAVCKMHMGQFDEAEKYLLKVCMYTYMYVWVCVCVCVCSRARGWVGGTNLLLEDRESESARVLRAREGEKRGEWERERLEERGRKERNLSDADGRTAGRETSIY